MPTPNSGPVSPLCAQGWHTIAVDGDIVYVRFAVRMRDRHGTYIYRFGPRPDDAACRTIWCYPDKGKPWICSTCRKPIVAFGSKPN